MYIEHFEFTFLYDGHGKKNEKLGNLEDKEKI